MFIYVPALEGMEKALTDKDKKSIIYCGRVLGGIVPDFLLLHPDWKAYRKKKILFKLSLGFFAGTMICEVLFILFRSMGAQMLLFTLQFLSVSACFAFGLCFLVRYMQGGKRTGKDFLVHKCE